jgi:restriction system-associated AAA family ATPase
MQLSEIELYKRFRGLQAGFHLTFTRPADPANKVSPFCFVGLNGSGKSNLMQLLAEIFYYLELFVLPGTESFFDSATVDGFRIRYRIPVTPRNFLQDHDLSDYISTLTWRNVTITKQVGLDPVFQFSYGAGAERIASRDQAPKLLPNQVIGYSSGMNELISIPFLKMDFFYLDMMRRKMKQQSGEQSLSTQMPSTYQDQFTVNRLFFLDYHSNAMMILANYLASDTPEGKMPELDIINDIVGIQELVSFRIAINYYIREEISIPLLVQRLQGIRQSTGSFSSFDLNPFLKKVEIPPEISHTINAMMDCSTTLKIVTEREVVKSGGDQKIRIEMYFKVDEVMKQGINDKIRGGSMQLFQQFYLLNLLNLDNYSEEIRTQIKGNNTAGSDVKTIITKMADKDKVFHVDAIRLKKRSGVIVYYNQLSDGEHQYMQVTGALKLINENASLFLMDEPETHLNPEWRSTLFSTLNNILKRRLDNDPDDFIPEQEIIVTSHSPFIVSDCQSEQVYLFNRNRQTGHVERPRHPDFNTYGASVNFLNVKVFNKKETIAGLANEQLRQLMEDVQNAIKTKEQAMEELTKLGDSVEKIIFIDELSKL